MKIRDLKTGKFVLTEKNNKSCAFCCRSFTPKPSHFKRRIFCSRICSGMAKIGESNNFYGKKHSLETKEMISENNARFWLGTKRPGVMKKGEESKFWVGENATYDTKHLWIRKVRCRAYECENCGITREDKQTKDGRNYIHWANVSGKYLRDISDYIALCYKCHGWFDSINRKEVMSCVAS